MELSDVELPDWFERFRPHQVVAIGRVVDAFRDGAGLVILDAPTGSGKTLIAEAVRQLLGAYRTSYVCSTRSLQDQFAGDYPYAAVLKGRSNYPSLTEGVTAADCTKTDGFGCTWCAEVSDCPYEKAKHTALRAPLSVLNTAYALTEWNHVGRFSGADMVVWDEADLAEQELMRHVEVDISPRQVEQLGLGEPRRVTKLDAWQEWVGAAIPTVRMEVSRQRARIRGRNGNKLVARDFVRVKRLLNKLTVLQEGLEEDEWIYTGKSGRVSFKPVHVRAMAPTMLWKHCSRWLMMSATVVSPEDLVGSLGWNGPWECVSVPSTFPVSNRRIQVLSAANMTRRVDERDKCGDTVARVAARHPDDRVLVHAVSYDLAGYLERCLRSRLPERRVTGYSASGERDAAIREFLGSQGGILVASSLDRGLDLPDDACRVVVVAKVPYPNLGDRQVSARLHSPGGDQWYRIQTVRTLVQMTGRAVRHRDDWSANYIVDSQFRDSLWSRSRSLFPAWWREGLVWNATL